MTNVTVRNATSADVDAVRNVGLSAWPVAFAFAGEDYIRDGLARWWSREAVDRTIGDTVVKVAEADGAVIGVANVDFRGDPATIWRLYVDPPMQGRGVGSLLLSTLLQEAHARAASAVALEFLEGNVNAARPYERNGFEVTGRETNDNPDWPARIWARKELVQP